MSWKVNLLLRLLLTMAEYCKVPPAAAGRAQRVDNFLVTPPPPPKKVKNTNNEAPQIPFSTSSVTQSQCAPG